MIVDRRRTPYKNTNFNTNDLEPTSTEESVRPFDYYREQWELEQIIETTRNPERLADALAEANYQLFDSYTGALSHLLMNPNDLENMHMRLEMVMEKIILEHLEKTNAYAAHIDELRESFYD